MLLEWVRVIKRLYERGSKWFQGRHRLHRSSIYPDPIEIDVYKEKKYVCCIHGSGKVYDRLNKGYIRIMLEMYDVISNLLKWIKSSCVGGEACAEFASRWIIGLV